ncbi:anthocyanidin 3-O-glucosyltransferase 2-like [Vitis vinifera]|uniref:anthocyanidin 3-O-glucosyltransferase 2-like n=1 Tax=Vitis vinifera TaxID=29760 RepID=UPI0001985C66|nr:anthocyanidin 3-O-glucosyltransferase 2-like [Vitis vinifera]|eukprot:XP_002265264.1 PREDICTED: anthocyanidin 3-O-glucosyltransferase 2-like [Vitis vinifera]
MMKKIELIFVSVSAIGHIVSTVEFAKLLVGRDDRFSVTLLIMKLPLEDSAATNYIHSVSASVSGSIRFVHLPELDSDSSSSSTNVLFSNIIERQKPLVRDAIHQLTRSESGRLAGIVVDLLCTSMIDVANELGVPSYVYFASSAACLALMFHLQTLKDHQGVDVTEFANSDAELVVPGFVNPVPARVLPAVAVDKEGGGSMDFLDLARGFREAKGILVNTFVELESHVINSFVDGTTPPIYKVGPLLNLQHANNQKPDSDLDVIRWLDDQPTSSVVFLCFGSAGAFHMDQINEIAIGLENSGHRFLWTLRRPPPKDKMAISSDYVNFEEVLPEGFLDRTSKIGKIIGWAPQTAILAHSAVGGFISHCGWNSTLESIWYGVPVATWPMYAEQQLNAFQIVRELEMGVEIRFDYNMDTSNLVSAQEIESRIRSLMDDSSNIRMKRTKMKEKCMKALTEGGSSDCSIQRLIGDIITNIS